MYMYIAPEGPPFGSDQMSVSSTYCHTAPVTQANPIRPQGPKYRCPAVRQKGDRISEPVWMRYLELLYATHAHHVAVVSGLYLHWLRYMSCVLVAGEHSWRGQLYTDLMSNQLRESEP